MPHLSEKRLRDVFCNRRRIAAALEF